MRVSVVFGDSIYSRGMQSALAELPEVSSVTRIESVPDALASSALTESHVVLLDAHLAGAEQLLSHLSSSPSPRIVMCHHAWDRRSVAKACEQGAAGVLDRDALTPETLFAALRAAAMGIAVFDQELLVRLIRADAPETNGSTPHPDGYGRLSHREHAVLSLVAEGLATREIAERMSYSERTVKNVLHDVVTKLGVRTRSQAVAHAIREHII